MSSSYLVNHHSPHTSSELDQLLLFATSSQAEEDKPGGEVDFAEVVLQDPGFLQPHEAHHASRQILHLAHHDVCHMRVFRDFS